MIPASPDDSAGQQRRPLSAVALAAAHLPLAHPEIRIDHVGGALDPALADAAPATMVAAPTYRWLGADYAGCFPWGDADALAAPAAERGALPSLLAALLGAR